MHIGSHDHRDHEEGGGRTKKKTDGDKQAAEEFCECNHEAPERRQERNAEVLHTASVLLPRFRTARDLAPSVKVHERKSDAQSEDKQADVAVPLECGPDHAWLVIGERTKLEDKILEEIGDLHLEEVFVDFDKHVAHDSLICFHREYDGFEAFLGTGGGRIRSEGMVV